MLFPPTLTTILPKLPFHNMEELGLERSERLSWVTGYDTEKHEWITSDGLECDATAYDQDAWSKLVKDQQTKDLIQSLLDTIGCSPAGPPSEQVRQGTNSSCPKALLRLFSATTNFPNLDPAARRQRCLQLFGRDDLPATFSSSEDASTAVRDAEEWVLIRENEKISWYELDDAFRIPPLIGLVCDGELAGMRMKRECNPRIENGRLNSLKQVRRRRDVIRDTQDALRVLS
ncbi:hypothetical protein EDD22DRAFT_947650 [Suillus occidentalis]|nr:hypothetical protein EDD22DRAFT_947650 [Suillus occidentalis]